MANKEFLEAYEAVFDERDKMKVCGRQACRNLIEAAKGIDEEKDFGNVRTGQICESSKDILMKMYYKNANTAFIDAYEKVFDERDKMKVCGRQAGKELIEAAKRINKETDFGNVRTGEIYESSKDILREMYYENASTAFIDAYESVFDEEGLMKDFKKDSLSELIEAAERVDKGADFGNPKTGEVRMESLGRMKSLYLHVKKQ